MNNFFFFNFNSQFFAHLLHCSTVQTVYVNDVVVGRDSAVGIATLYGLDGPWDRIPVGARFFTPVRTGPGAYPASYTMGTVSFLGIKRPRRDADYPPPSPA